MRSGHTFSSSFDHSSRLPADWFLPTLAQRPLFAHRPRVEARRRGVRFHSARARLLRSPTPETSPHGFYENRILPRLIDVACSTPPILKQREKVVPEARGRVLEVGMGSAINLPFYDPDKSRVRA